MSITASRLQYLDAIGVQVWEERTSTCEAVLVSTAKIDNSQELAEPLPKADWFIVGAGESSQKQPGNSKEADLLSNILLAAGIVSSDIYITAAGNTSDQAGLREFVRDEIERVQPNVILVFGADDAQRLLRTNDNIDRLRQSAQKLEGISAPIIVSHGLQYLIENPLAKSDTWIDVQQASKLVGQELKAAVQEA
ncbi:MAG: hypothetical protein A6F70_04905 [Cycloclasticus sp. symbiont of Bathymodiolus heckerae]|nr:MAG: hypothetical protein A6F70_04905 [Cycloclasticus sp. symbiont of Bathymodiolus heckerae]